MVCALAMLLVVAKIGVSSANAQTDTKPQKILLNIQISPSRWIQVSKSHQ
jgi:hypothetical protein